MRGTEGRHGVYGGMPASSVPTDVQRTGKQKLAAEHIFLDVGGRPLVPKMPGLEKVPYLTNVSRSWTSTSCRGT